MPKTFDEKWDAFREKLAADPDILRAEDEPENVAPEPEEVDDPEGEEAKQEPETTAEGDTTAETPEGEGDTPKPAGEDKPAADAVSTVLPTRFRGADRGFDISKPAERDEAIALIQKGLNAEAIVAEADEKVAKRANERLEDWFAENGWSRGPKGQRAVNPDGIVAWVEKNLGQEVLKSIAAKYVPPAPADGGFAKEATEMLAQLEKEADPENPADAALLRLARTNKALADRLAVAEGSIDQRVKPLADRFQQIDHAARQAAIAKGDSEVLNLLGAEAKKYPTLADFSDDDRSRLKDLATARAYRDIASGTATPGPDLVRAAIAAEVKAEHDRRAAWAARHAASTKTNREAARPAPSAPPKKTASAPPAKPMKRPPPGTPEYDDWFKGAWKSSVEKVNANGAAR